jgi:hypothetical protein
VAREGSEAGARASRPPLPFTQVGYEFDSQTKRSVCIQKRRTIERHSLRNRVCRRTETSHTLPCWRNGFAKSGQEKTRRERWPWCGFKKPKTFQAAIETAPVPNSIRILFFSVRILSDGFDIHHQRREPAGNMKKAKSGSKLRNTVQISLQLPHADTDFQSAGQLLALLIGLGVRVTEVCE